MCCGLGYKGKLGLGDTTSRSIPTLVPGLEDVVQVVAGGIHSAAVDGRGRVWTWGCGSDGRLGHPGAEGHRYLFREDTPTVVEELERVGRVEQLASSYYHMAAVVEGEGGGQKRENKK